MKTIECPSCGNKLAENEPTCKYCGSTNPIYVGKTEKKEEYKPLAKQAEPVKDNSKISKRFGIASIIFAGSSLVSYIPFVILGVVIAFVLAVFSIVTFGLGLLVAVPIFAIYLIITALAPIMCVVLGIILSSAGLGLSNKIINNYDAKRQARTICLVGLILNITIIVLSIVISIISAIFNKDASYTTTLALIAM